MLLVWAIFSTFLCVISVFIIVNLLKKYEKLEDEYERYASIQEQNNKELTNRILFIDREIKSIDKRGSFESDDEVGFFFKKIKEFRDLLKEYISE